MDNALYVGLSRQMTLQRALDITANNIANMDTAGFKVEQLSVRDDPIAPPASAGLGFTPVQYVLDDGVARNFGQGEFQTTDAPYDLAIQGDGFFTVQTADGNRYTRDGRFSLDAQNQLVDRHGDPVLSSSGAAIAIDPTKSMPLIAKDGTISQTGPNGQVTQVGQLGLVRLADRSALGKQGDDLYADASGQTAVAATDAAIQQGMVERSNVQPVSEITNLIQITRAYERVQDMMSSTQEMSSKAIDALGKLN